MKVPRGLLRRFDGDLKRAGIAKRDTDGRTVDLHSLRKTFITAVVQSGVDARTAMELARHSDSRMTLGVYAEPDHRAAIAVIDRTFGRSAGDTLYDPPVTQNGQKGSHQATHLSVPDSLSKCFFNSVLTESGREDLNLRPLAPHAITGGLSPLPDSASSFLDMTTTHLIL